MVVVVFLFSFRLGFFDFLVVGRLRFILLNDLPLVLERIFLFWGGGTARIVEDFLVSFGEDFLVWGGGTARIFLFWRGFSCFGVYRRNCKDFLVGRGFSCFGKRNCKDFIGEDFLVLGRRNGKDFLGGEDFLI